MTKTIIDPYGNNLKVKTIKRQDENNVVGEYFNSGIFADGHLAYSKLTGNIVKPEDEGTYAQIREDGHLKMIHI